MLVKTTETKEKIWQNFYKQQQRIIIKAQANEKFLKQFFDTYFIIILIFSIGLIFLSIPF